MRVLQVGAFYLGIIAIVAVLFVVLLKYANANGPVATEVGRPPTTGQAQWPSSTAIV